MSEIRWKTPPLTEAESKADLDRREIQWFKDQRGWVLPEGADVDSWLMEMRLRDEALS